MPCPFGFTAAEPNDDAESLSGEDEPRKPDAAAAFDGQCPYSAMFAQKADSDEKKNSKGSGKKAKDAERFSYDKDPVSWFYQNQIKCEEEFQQRKSELREEAKRRLDAIMDKKGKRLEWNSDSDSDWSVSTNEISEMDSDVDSISSMVSCANSWIVEYEYPMPATTTVKLLTIASMLLHCYIGYTAYGAYSSATTYWGIIQNGWITIAAMVLSATCLSWLATAVILWRSLSRRWLVACMVGLHILEACAFCLGGVVMGFPVAITQEVKNIACQKHTNTNPGYAELSKLCKALPTINDALKSVNVNIMWTAGIVAITCFSMLLALTWFEMELTYIEKRSSKHKRRRRRRKHQIPWDKLKVIGKVSTCGGGPVAPKKAAPAVAKEQVLTDSTTNATAAVQPTAAGKKKISTATDKAAAKADDKTAIDTAKIKAT